jgi:2-polyprenyl-3-methyl-5-hydroxy-6-metoxy-1,4-benzoquinol methylase
MKHKTVNFQQMTIQELPDQCNDEIRLKIPLKYRRGLLRKDERKSIESAIENLKQISKLIGREDWSDQNVLDFGCGVKFTQALVQYGVDVKNYVGMDVYTKLIKYLSKKVDHPNLHFYDVPFRNEKYNPKGVELTADAVLPGDINVYDIITLQSVFTHFNPADFLALLLVLRRYAVDDTRMFFTCFINNNMNRDFIDLIPGRPLHQAYYKEHSIRNMLAESGWQPLWLNPPSAKMMCQFVCKPI